MIVVYILLIAAAVFLNMLLRFFFQRLSLLVQLKRFTQKYGYLLKVRNYFYFYFPTNRSSESTVTIETNDNYYNIRLFGLLRKHCEVHFWNLKAYSVDSYMTRREFVYSEPIGERNVKHRPLGEFPKPELTANKTVVPILLFSPTNVVVRLKQTVVNRYADLRAGDKIDEALFADTDFLFRHIAYMEKQDY